MERSNVRFAYCKDYGICKTLKSFDSKVISTYTLWSITLPVLIGVRGLVYKNLYTDILTWNAKIYINELIYIVVFIYIHV